VTFHRTVRVPEGRVASNLPPSLGRMKLFKVSDFQKNCPQDWAQEACFTALHETEAMWISFRAIGKPCAVLIGAGGVNALTGQKLGTKLEKDNYLVCPPQPWIDGWKDVDGTVHQFVATPHKKGKGISVGEQLIGADSKTGAIGVAIFDPKEDVSLRGIFQMPKKKLRQNCRTTEFPFRLKQERERLGLTQKELATKIETTATTIARWERGDVTPLPVFEKAILTMLSVFPGHKQED